MRHVHLRRILDLLLVICLLCPFGTASAAVALPTPGAAQHRAPESDSGLTGPVAPQAVVNVHDTAPPPPQTLELRFPGHDAQQGVPIPLTLRALQGGKPFSTNARVRLLVPDVLASVNGQPGQTRGAFQEFAVTLSNGQAQVQVVPKRLGPLDVQAQLDQPGTAVGGAGQTLIVHPSPLIISGPATAVAGQPISYSIQVWDEPHTHTQTSYVGPLTIRTDDRRASIAKAANPHARASHVEHSLAPADQGNVDVTVVFGSVGQVVLEVHDPTNPGHRGTLTVTVTAPTGAVPNGSTLPASPSVTPSATATGTPATATPSPARSAATATSTNTTTATATATFSVGSPTPHFMADTAPEVDGQTAPSVHGEAAPQLSGQTAPAVGVARGDERGW